MPLDKEQIGAVALEAMDELDEGGSLDIPGAQLEAVALIVAVGDDEDTTVNYRIKAGDGSDLNRRDAARLLAQVLANLLD